ncbi:MAG: hypothetical protein H7246_16955 [Phycisphaerae bacterium]|nr:hypothetical protein [Saprospiraceae bacterium]
MNATSNSTQKTSRPRPLTAFAIWGVTYIGARLIVAEVPLGFEYKLALSFLPLLPFVWMVYEFIRAIRSMDELHKQIHLEALVVAFPLCIITVMTLGLLEMFMELSKEDWSYRHLIPFFFIYYFAGLFIARKRYGL